MSASKNRIPVWLTLIIVVAGGPSRGFWAVELFARRSALHPDPRSRIGHRGASPTWIGAVGKGRQLARAGLSQQNLPGLSVAVGVGGEVVWAEGFGWADIENRVPVAPGSRFRIGHVSKALTSAAVGLLREKGRLHLDDEIQAYVPAFPGRSGPSHCAS